MVVFRGNERYIARTRLGEGAFGEVYAGWDTRRDEPVALKLLKQTDPRTLLRFKKEFRTLIDLVHPNLVALRELVCDADRWFFSMELIEGKDLVGFVQGVASGNGETTFPDDVSDRDARSPLPTATAPAAEVTLESVRRLRGLLPQLVRGVVALHAAGRIHRDLKPSNVLVTDDGRVVILDFGMVSSVDDNIRISRGVVGTVAYMAPEQVMTSHVKPAADWYALGTMIYQVLANRLPFDGAPIEVILAKRDTDPLRPSTFGPCLDRDLEDLCMELLSREPMSRPNGNEILRRLGDAAAPESTLDLERKMRTRGTSVVGRQHQLDDMQRAFSRIHEGRPVLLSLDGPSGIGKTTLVRRFLELLSRDEQATVLEGRCHERESVPFRAVDGVMDHLMHHLLRFDRERLLAVVPKDMWCLSRVFSVLQECDPWRGRLGHLETVSDPTELRRRAFLAAQTLFCTLGQERPVAIFIDDFQWADADSLPLIVEILSASKPTQVMLIIAHRDVVADAESPVSVLLTAMAHLDRCDVIRHSVAGLTSDEARQWVVGALADRRLDAHADLIVKEAAGNPFALNEFLRWIAAHANTASSQEHEGKLDIDRVICSRLEALSENAQHILKLLAACGHPVRLDVLEQIVTGAVATSIRELEAAKLIRWTEGDARVEPRHDRIRAALTRSLSKSAVEDYHRQMAVAVEATRAVDAAALVEHWLKAGEWTKAGQYAVAAAKQACETAAFERGVSLYRLAIELASDEQQQRVLWEALGDALVHAHHGVQAAEAYLSAVPRDDEDKALELRRKAVAQFMFSGHLDRAFFELHRLLDDVGLKSPSGTFGAMAEFVLRDFGLRLRGLTWRARSEAEIKKRDLVRVDLCLDAAQGLAMVDVVRSAVFAARAATMGLKLGEPKRVVRGLQWLGVLRGWSGPSAARAVDAIFRAAEAIGRDFDDPALEAWSQIAQGATCSNMGDKKQCCDRMLAALHTLSTRCTGQTWLADTASIWLVESLATMGRLMELRGHLPEMLRIASDRGDIYATTTLRSFSYIMWMADDDVAAGRSALHEASHPWTKWGFLVPHYWQLIANIRYALYLGTPTGAWDYATSGSQDLVHSRLLYLQNARIVYRAAHAAAALGAARELGPSESPAARKLFAVARRGARALIGEKARWAEAQGLLLLAGLEANQGDDSKTIEHLRAAERAFLETHMELHAAVAGHFLGVRIGGTEGQARIARARAFMEEQRIVRPEHMMRALAPGLDR